MTDYITVGQIFINIKRQKIEIKNRFWNSDDVVEYLVVCQGTSGRINHQKVLTKIEDNEWIKT